MSAANDTTLPQFLTTQEAAAYLRSSKPTLERLRTSGEGPTFIKLGPGRRGRVVYKREDLDAFVSARRRNSTSER